MINLVPPVIKEEIRYAKRNALIVKALVGLGILLAFLSAALIGGQLYLERQITSTDTQLADTQLKIESYKPLEKSATAVSTRVHSIESILADQAHFSQLLNDLSQYMPRGTVIASIGFTGDDKKPIKLVVSAIDYDTAVAFRDTITKLKRISAADIQSIQSTTGDGTTFGGKRTYYQIVVTFGFNKGAAR